MNKTQEKKLCQRKKQRATTIRITAATLLILIVASVSLGLYRDANYRTTTAIIIRSQREITGFHMSRAGNTPVWGTYLTVEFTVEDQPLRSEAIVKEFSELSTGDKVTVQFNKRNPGKCYLIQGD
jgi:hypothetical protein